jgi:carbon-monoxide dehydrogenase medium subunit
MTSAYLFPQTIEETLGMLRQHAGRARIIAGGTDLMLQIKQGKYQVETFVDITRVPELNGIRLTDDGYIWVGAATTHRQVWESPIIQEHASVLAEACRAVGALQIQNVGTLGGNVVNAMPAADGSIALTALSAEAQIAAPYERYWTDLLEVFSRPGVCKIDPSAELLVAFRFKALGRRAGSAFERLARRRALSLPILNCGVVVQLNEAGDRFEHAAIALGPVAPTPFRARGAEAILAGAPVNEDTIRAAAHRAMEESDPRSNILRASREYRKDMVEVLTRRALERAVQQALARA